MRYGHLPISTLSSVGTFADQAVIAIENARLIQKLEERNQDLSQALAGESEALEQQTAMAHILSVIASSPADLQPVLDAVAVSASHLCDASDAVVTLADGELLRQRAHAGSIPPDFTPFPLAGSRHR